MKSGSMCCRFVFKRTRALDTGTAAPADGQNQRTEELAQFLHQIGTRRNGHTTLVMPLKLHQKMICPVVGLRAGQHTGAALIRQMDIQSHSADKESVMIYFLKILDQSMSSPGSCVCIGRTAYFLLFQSAPASGRQSAAFERSSPVCRNKASATASRTARAANSPNLKCLPCV